MSIGSFFGSIVGGAATGAVSPAAQVVDGASKLIGMFKLDATTKAQLQAQLVAENVDLEKAQLAADLAAVQGQLEINKQEAASTNGWVAGWRPYIGWTCGTALAWEFVIKPFLVFFLAVFHHAPLPVLPALDTAALISGILAPLLGLGTMRSVEKIQGADGAEKLQ